MAFDHRLKEINEIDYNHTLRLLQHPLHSARAAPTRHLDIELIMMISFPCRRCFSGCCICHFFPFLSWYGHS